MATLVRRKVGGSSAGDQAGETLLEFNDPSSKFQPSATALLGTGPSQHGYLLKRRRPLVARALGSALPDFMGCCCKVSAMAGE